MHTADLKSRCQVLSVWWFQITQLGLAGMLLRIENRFWGAVPELIVKR